MKGKTPNIIDHNNKIFKCIDSSTNINHLKACENMIVTFQKEHYKHVLFKTLDFHLSKVLNHKTETI